jgi:acyl carrier protein
LTGHASEVSLDGYRVSLAEIEQQLKSHPSIAEAVVLFNEDDPFRPHFIAFVVLPASLPSSPQFLVPELKSHLRQHLPDFMVPDVYVKIAMMPRDTNGDVQYEWLKVPEDDSKKTDTPTLTPREVASIVGDVMNINGVGTEANLSQLGMNSLQTMSLMARLQSTYGVVPTIAQVASSSTISEVSHHLSEAMRGGQSQMLRPLHQESRLS